MIYLGIDNGLSGGLAAYTDNGYLLVRPMPIVTAKTKKGNKNEYDIPEIVAWLEQVPEVPKMVVLEKAQTFPGMAAQSTFTNARNFGIIEGILSCMRYPYTIIHPKTWQKKMFEGVAHTDTKQASVLVARRLFPSVVFTLSEKARKPQDGMTDAALMAYYAYLLYK